MPPPSSFSVIRMRLPCCSARENQLPFFGLSKSLANVWRLDAVVDGVADQMRERLGDLVDDPLVDLGLAAANGELDFLVERAREVANRPRKRVENRCDRQHGQLDDVLAQLFRDQVEPHAVVAEADQKLAHAPGHRVERVGMLGELRDPIGRAGVWRQASFAHAIAKMVEHPFQAPQLCVPLEGLEALDDHLGREMRQPVELLDRHAQRLPQLRRFGLKDRRGRICLYRGQPPCPGTGV